MKIFKVVLFALMVVGFIACKGPKEQPEQVIPETVDIESVSSTEVVGQQEPDLKSDTGSSPNTSAATTITASTPTRSEKLVVATTNTKPSSANQNKTVLPPPPPIVASPKVIINDETPSPPVKQSNTLPNHTSFNELLQKYVDADGKVNYTSLKNNRKSLDDYLDDLATASNITKWGRNEQLAYWINLYNASTLQLVIDNFPLKSIKDASFGKPWDTYFIKVGSVTYTLNEIENNIIRKQFNDPRIHFAVNCAAKSCPPLLNKAYTAANVDKLLTSNTRAFINSSFNEINAKSVVISNIFKWYAVDFGEIPSFINQYSKTKTADNAKITYKDYDWSLNGY